MSTIYYHPQQAANAVVSSAPPVFRGYDALGIETADLAKMINLTPEQLAVWRSGAEALPDNWSIFLTDVLNRLVEGMEVGTTAITNDAAMARNWLELAQENIRDLPRQAFDGARRLAYAPR
jgi:hypothetical protein